MFPEVGNKTVGTVAQSMMRMGTLVAAIQIAKATHIQTVDALTSKEQQELGSTFFHLFNAKGEDRRGVARVMATGNKNGSRVEPEIHGCEHARGR